MLDETSFGLAIWFPLRCHGGAFYTAEATDVLAFSRIAAG